MKTLLDPYLRRQGMRYLVLEGVSVPAFCQPIPRELTVMKRSLFILDRGFRTEILVTGKHQAKLVDALTTLDPNEIDENHYASGLILDDEGLVRHHVYVCRFANGLLVSIFGSHYETFQRLAGSYLSRWDVELSNLSDYGARLAILGPGSLDLARSILLDDPERVGVREVDRLPFSGKEIMVSVLPSHVGEGVECHVPASVLALFWESLERRRDQFAWELVGHGARPLLRWESGHPTFYRDFRGIPAVVDDVFNPVMTRKGNFLGREAVLEALEKDVKPSLVPFSYYDAHFIPRDTPIQIDGETIGRTTSSMMHPGRRGIVGWILMDPSHNVDETEAIAEEPKRKTEVVLHRRGDPKS